jgi:hypothetical protein
MYYSLKMDPKFDSEVPINQGQPHIPKYHINLITVFVSSSHTIYVTVYYNMTVIPQSLSSNRNYVRNY